MSLTAAWYRDLSKLTLVELVYKFSAIYVNRQTIHYRFRNGQSLGRIHNQINPIYSIPPCFLIQFRVYHLRLCLPKRFFPASSPTELVQTFDISPFVLCAPSFPIFSDTPITFSSATLDRCSSIRVGDQVAHPNSIIVFGCNRVVHLRQCFSNFFFI